MKKLSSDLEGQSNEERERQGRGNHGERGKERGNDRGEIIRVFWKMRHYKGKWEHKVSWNNLNWKKVDIKGDNSEFSHSKRLS